MRDIKFKAWCTRDGGVMLQVGDEYGTTSPLDCCSYFLQGQPVELLQFTGMKDINGVEIYEGDIVSSDYFEPEIKESGAVVYNNNEMKFMVDSQEVDAFIYGNLEVIGNIYQNPEMRDKAGVLGL